MRFQKQTRWIVAVTSALLVVVTLGWLVQWLWQAAGHYDRNPSRGALTDQMMHRKSKAMQDILEGMIRGDFRRLETAAKQMETYGKATAWYLPHSEYENQGEEFQRSVDDLIAAAGRKDTNSAKEATLRLERSCIECHVLINQPKQGL